MSSLQYVIDLIKQAYEWLNERLEKRGLEGRKLQAAKLLTMAILITIAYFVINPLPWEQSKGLRELKAIHLTFKAGKPPEWPLDWKPIAPTKAKSSDKKTTRRVMTTTMKPLRLQMPDKPRIRPPITAKL